MDLDFLTHTPFWIALGQIIIIDILLGGDNAVVIALSSAVLCTNMGIPSSLIMVGAVVNVVKRAVGGLLLA